MGANLAPSTTLPFINSALYVPFGGTSLGRLSIRIAKLAFFKDVDFGFNMKCGEQQSYMYILSRCHKT